MSTEITSSASSCGSYLNSSGIRACINPHHSGLYNLKRIKTLKKIHQPQLFLNFSHKYGISRTVPVSGNIRPKASSSSPQETSSSPWKKWLLGVVLTVVLPAAGHKGGLFLALKAKIDQTIATVENVAEVVEEVAEAADKLVEEVEEKLPEDSKLKEAFESFDALTEAAVKEAKKAEDLIHKVKDTEKEMEAMFITSSNDKAKKVDS